ncbi:hypothetical protein ACFPRL_36615 [Pseudoclavibacter helvolus]
MGARAARRGACGARTPPRPVTQRQRLEREARGGSGADQCAARQRFSCAGRHRTAPPTRATSYRRSRAHARNELAPETAPAPRAPRGRNRASRALAAPTPAPPSRAWFPAHE